MAKDQAEFAKGARAALARLLDDGPALSVETLKSVMRQGTQQGHDERLKANARTATYKVRQTLARAPESEDVMTAAGYLLLGLIEEHPEQSEDALRRLTRQLTLAGFDKDQSAQAIARLAVDVRARRADWHRRLKLRAIRRLVSALPEDTPITRTG
jgi:hypothetical protein